MNFLAPGRAVPLRNGKLTEVSAFTPVIKGRVPGERRTYEERLRFSVSRLADKLDSNIPSELHLIHTLHFGRITIIRPEQYLLFAKLVRQGQAGGPYNSPGPVAKAHSISLSWEERVEGAKEEIEEKRPDPPAPVDDYREDGSPAPLSDHRTWVLTQVVFDGDVKAYFRDIANRLGSFFDTIYENCEDYPGTGNFEKFWQWIGAYQLQSDMFYAGNPHLSVTRIRELEDFKRRFDLFVTKVRSADGSRPENMDELFDQFLMETRQRPSGFPAYGGIYTGALDFEGGKK